MGITCAICGKKQSSLLEDFPLSTLYPNDRVCVKCDSHMQTLMETQDEKTFNTEKSYFESILAKQQATENAIAYFEMLFKIKSNCKPGESIEKEISKHISTLNDKKAAELEKAKKAVKLTTGNSFDGYRITEYIDVIFEEKITGIGIKTSLKSLGDIFASLTGDEKYAISERINELKIEIINSLREKAVNLGANGIIGIDFETTLPGGSAIMVSVNGTAVKIEEFRSQDYE